MSCCSKIDMFGLVSAILPYCEGGADWQERTYHASQEGDLEAD
jgi:hypothetical protein